jgi:hypothetical protein
VSRRLLPARLWKSLGLPESHALWMLSQRDLNPQQFLEKELTCQLVNTACERVPGGATQGMPTDSNGLAAGLIPPHAYFSERVVS